MTVAEDPSNYCFNLLSTTALIKQYIYWLNTVSRHEWQSKRKTSLNRQQQLLGNVWTAGTLEGSPFSESAICSGKGILNKRVNSVKTVNIKSLNCIIFVCCFFFYNLLCCPVFYIPGFNMMSTEGLHNPRIQGWVSQSQHPGAALATQIGRDGPQRYKHNVR